MIYKFLWGDGKVVLEPGMKKDFHHFTLMNKLVQELGHAPVRYVAGGFSEDLFHGGQFPTVSINWSGGKNLPTPEELKVIIQASLLKNR